MRRIPLLPNSPLLPLPQANNDKRHAFRVGAAFSLPKLSEIPLTNWELDQNPIENQSLRADFMDDMCAAFALTSVLEPQEGVAFDPGFSFMLAKEQEGTPDTFGANLDTIGMGAVRVGPLPLAKSPFPDRPRSFVADWRNWPAVYREYALEHRQKAMLWVQGPYDTFDNIRATLWLLKTLPPGRKRSGILAGSYWYSEWNAAPHGVVPKTPQTSQPSAHAFRIRGQQVVNGEPYVVAQDSSGLSAGDKGLYLFPREVVNREFPLFGQAIFVDMTPEEIAAIRQQRISTIQRLIQWLSQLLPIFSPKPTPPAPLPAPQPAPTPEPVPVSESLQDMVRRVCREEKLDASMTAVLMATIHGESGWNPKAVNRNANGSTDYGLCQFNSKWYIGPTLDVKTPEEAMNDPEKCVRVMARAFKRGRAIDWIAYRNGSYKKYLSIYT